VLDPGHIKAAIFRIGMIAMRHGREHGQPARQPESEFSIASSPDDWGL
jgi:hypothetical protein